MYRGPLWHHSSKHFHTTRWFKRYQRKQIIDWWKCSFNTVRKPQWILFFVSEIFLKMFFVVFAAEWFWLHLSPISVCFPAPTGMASAVRLPPFRRPQNVSAALSSSDAVRYRCHAAPLRPQHHRESGQQHHRVSQTTAISDMCAIVAKNELCFPVNCK